MDSIDALDEQRDLIDLLDENSACCLERHLLLVQLVDRAQEP